MVEEFSKRSQGEATRWEGRVELEATEEGDMVLLSERKEGKVRSRCGGLWRRGKRPRTRLMYAFGFGGWRPSPSTGTDGSRMKDADESTGRGGESGAEGGKAIKEKVMTGMLARRHVVVSRVTSFELLAL